MSANIVRGFFPSVTDLVDAHPLFMKLWSFVFPPEVEELCPRPHLSLKVSRDLSITIHWPLASVFCVLGIFMGLSHSIPLLSETCRSRNPKNGHLTWGLAFMCYGLMSLGGLTFHCILTTSNFFYVLDVGSTALCCMAIISGIHIATSSRSHPRTTTSLDDTRLVCKVGMCSMFFLVFTLAFLGPQYIRDLLYVVPALLALGFALRFYANAMSTSPNPFTRSLLWLHCSAFSTFLALSAVIFDSWLCRTLGAEFGVLPWFFLGSDIALPCLYYSIKDFETHVKHS